MLKKMKLKDIHTTVEGKNRIWFTLTPRSDKLKLRIMLHSYNESQQDALFLKFI
jgi:hypothetical protein